MKIKISASLIFWGFLVISSYCYAQEKDNSEEESAEVFLDEYSDSFQEKFFEALKQKGIENYDKAIVSLLECKKINPENKAVDFELAKLYLETKQLDLAQEYAINSIKSDPENFWYLHNLISILNLKRSDVGEIENLVSVNNTIVFKQNLALVYYRMENYKKASEVLNSLNKSTFSENLNVKIEHNLEQIKQNNEAIVLSDNPIKNIREETSTLNSFKTKIEHLIHTKNYLELETVSKEALDNFPAQPFFYYARGFVLNKKGNYTEAVGVLEESLDYMLDDLPLKNKIYKELVDAYTALNNTIKANSYQKKINPGF